MTPQQQPKILAEKKLPTGIIYYVKIGNEKPKWLWKNKLPKEAVDAWVEHLSR